MNKTHTSLCLFVAVLMLQLSACGKKEDAEAKAVRALPVSVTTVRSEAVEELELSDGRIESLRAPKITKNGSFNWRGIHPE